MSGILVLLLSQHAQSVMIFSKYAAVVFHSQDSAFKLAVLRYLAHLETGIFL